MKRNLILIAVSFVLIVSTLLIGNVIVIGEKLGEVTHVYVEYAFYSALFVITFVYLVIPIIKVHNAPEIPVLSANRILNEKQILDFARNLAKHCDYIQDKDNRKIHQQELVQSVKENATNEAELRKIITEEVALRMDGNKEMQVLGINKRIKEWGKTVFMVTAVSQNSKFDTLSVLLMNYRMIYDIVMASGFRPTKPQMFKLYVRVLTTALVTYCVSQVFGDIDGVAPFDWSDASDKVLEGSTEIQLDSSDLESVGTIREAISGTLSNLLGNLQRVKIPEVVTSSIMNGGANVLMTLRIGYVTRAYLTEGSNSLSGVKNKRRVKLKAMKDALKVLPSVIALGAKDVGISAFKLMKNSI